MEIKNFEGVFGSATIDKEGIIAFEPALKMILKTGDQSWLLNKKILKTTIDIKYFIFLCFN